MEISPLSKCMKISCAVFMTKNLTDIYQICPFFLLFLIVAYTSFFSQTIDVNGSSEIGQGFVNKLDLGEECGQNGGPLQVGKGFLRHCCMVRARPGLRLEQTEDTLCRTS